MGTQVRLKVVTPERVVYDKDVQMVVARGAEGELGILFDHTPLVTPIIIGVLKVKVDNTFYPIAVSGGGFLEIKPDQITVLADTAELPEEIDLDRAEAAKRRAEERLARVERAEDPSIDVVRAQAAMQRAMARIRAVESRRN